MNHRSQILQLERIGQLLLDTRLAALRSAAAAREESEGRLAGLVAADCNCDDMSEISAQLAMLGYQRWADARRSEINLTLARQTAAWMEAKDAARDAFNKNEALRALGAKRL